MSIRFKCTTCHTVLKIGERISVQRKVRCTGCGLVILLTPDDDAPDGMTVSVPERPARMGLSEREIARRRYILIGILAVLAAGVGYGIYSTTRGPADRGTIEGTVALDEGPMEKGEITFIPVEGTPGSEVKGAIVRGRYSLSGDKGPHIGTHRVEIRGEREDSVAKQFNVDSKTKIEIKAGNNTKDFDVKSK